MMIVDELPFSPFNETLSNILRSQYIKPVANWLLGKKENSLLAQEGNSAWETGLTIMFLAYARDIFNENNEEPQLRDVICQKTIAAVKWLLSRKVVSPIDKNICWEYVTYDTSVVIHALLMSLKKYKNYFDDNLEQEIVEATVSAMKWLQKRFNQWETQVKYPFGPTDVAQIVITALYISDEFPKVYERICQEWGGDALVADIIEYLLFKKTEKILTYETVEGVKDQIISYMWEDFLNTAEVVEAIAMFYKHCQSSIKHMERYKDLLDEIKIAIVRSCTFFEQGQVEGMWGSHLETIRVLHTYVSIRNMVQHSIKGSNNPLIIPEMHAIFKALRWMCDRKQVFPDGSFLHTMLLTIYYAHTLIEVYHTWEHVHDSVEKIYDDVVWFSPIRTTAERSKRLATEMKYIQLKEENDYLQREDRLHQNAYFRVIRNLVRIVMISIICFAGISLFLLIGNLTGVLYFTLIFKVLRVSDFFQYLAVCVTVFIALLTLAWGYDKLVAWGQRRYIRRNKRRMYNTKI